MSRPVGCWQRLLLGLILLCSLPVFAVDPNCDTNWIKTSTTWTCSGDGTVTFSANTSFTPATALTIEATNGFVFNNNQIGSSNARVVLQSNYGSITGSNSTIYGDLTAVSGNISLDQVQVIGLVYTVGNVSLSGGSVTGLVTSLSNTVTTNGTNLYGGVKAHSGLFITGGTVTGDLVMSASNQLTLTNVTMPSGSIRGANSIVLDNVDLGSASSTIDISAQTNDIYVNNGSVVYGNLTAAGNYGVVYVQGGSVVYGVCLPQTVPVNACNPIPPASVDHYELQYNSPGLTCQAEPVTIRACSNASCSSYYSGAVSVTLTASGTASWSNTSPTFSSGSASSSVRLTTAGSTTLAISSASPTATGALVCKSGAIIIANCGLSFTDTGLKIYANDGLAALPTLTAGQGYTGSLRAIQTNANTGACQARVQGTQQVALAFRCLNPTSCISGQTL